MGALTDSRKRYFVDLFSPVTSVTPASSFPLPVANSELLTSAPASKKPKVSPPEASESERGAMPPPPREEKQEKGPVRHEVPPRFPPAVPLRRQVIGPQRILKVFGLGSPQTAERKMGPFETERPDSAAGTATPSKFTKNKRARWSPLDAGREGSLQEGKHDLLADGITDLKLEEYKRLVEIFQEDTVPFTPPAAGTTPTVVVAEEEAEVTPVTRKDVEVSSLKILNKRVEDARKMVEMRATPDGSWTKRTPLYKDLLEESAKKHDQRLTDLSFEVKLAEERLSGIRLEKKPIDAKKHIKDDIAGPFAPLSEEENDDIDMTLQEIIKMSQRHEVLVVHEPSNIEITREVIQCLRYGAWLNDEVINLYLELLKEREKREPMKFLKCHFFNTFFYKKLVSGRGVYDFKAVRRWTTHRKLGYGIVDCDKVFVPIHKEIHWCLAIIDIKRKKFLYLDSLGGWDKEVLNNLGRYLVDEAKDKNNQIIDVESWKQEYVDGLPLQKNGWDCGMFMLKYADFYSRGLDLLFGQEDMSYFRRRTVKEIIRLKAE